MKQAGSARNVFLLCSQVAFLAVAVGGLTAKTSDQAGWLGLLGFMLTLVPDFLRRTNKLVLPLSYEIVFIGYIFLSFIGGENFDMYGRFWWWDRMLHFTSGIIIGYIAVLVLHIQELKHRIKIGHWFAALFTLASVVMSAGVWEMFEYSVDQLVQGHMQYGLVDTMTDIINGTIGGIVVILVTYWYFKYRPKKGVVTKAFSNFVKLNPWVAQGR